jgi:hypothetical protein
MLRSAQRDAFLALRRCSGAKRNPKAERLKEWSINKINMLRIAVQSKGRLYEDTMDLLKETGIKINSARRTLLVQSSNFPIEVLYMRDDDNPECVASGIADIGIVGEN